MAIIDDGYFVPNVKIDEKDLRLITDEDIQKIKLTEELKRNLSFCNLGLESLAGLYCDKNGYVIKEIDGEFYMFKVKVEELARKELARFISLKEYYEKFFDGKDKKDLPDEHHFVSVYLFPRLKEIFGRYPDYINPDGMKELPGDIIYCDKNGKSKFAIEVKYGAISFTKTEYDNWVENDSGEKPDYFIALGKEQIVLCDWKSFSTKYKTLQQTPVKDYSTSVSVDSINSPNGRLNLSPEFVGKTASKLLDFEIYEKLKAWSNGVTIA